MRGIFLPRRKYVPHFFLSLLIYILFIPPFLIPKSRNFIPPCLDILTPDSLYQHANKANFSFFILPCLDVPPLNYPPYRFFCPMVSSWPTFLMMSSYCLYIFCLSLLSDLLLCIISCTLLVLYMYLIWSDVLTFNPYILPGGAHMLSFLALWVPMHPESSAVSAQVVHGVPVTPPSKGCLPSTNIFLLHHWYTWGVLSWTLIWCIVFTTINWPLPGPSVACVNGYTPIYIPPWHVNNNKHIPPLYLLVTPLLPCCSHKKNI